MYELLDSDKSEQLVAYVRVLKMLKYANYQSLQLHLSAQIRLDTVSESGNYLCVLVLRTFPNIGSLKLMNVCFWTYHMRL